MQSAGQAAAQSEQPTHFSSPFSWRWRMWRPRKRGYTGRLYSGYCSVTGFRNRCRKVTPKPLIESTTAISLLEREEHGGDDEVQRGDREEHLPADAHEAVVAHSRERRAHPDRDEDEERHLEQHPHRPRQERPLVAAQEQHRGERRERDEA